MQIEKEIRYYFSDEKLDKLVEKLKTHYSYTHSYHEITTMYDNPNQDFTFYSKEVDGRLRLRYSKQVEAPLFGIQKDGYDVSQCLVTWKRRLPAEKTDAIRREEEIEYTTNANDFDSVRAIFEDVLKCKRVSSYERIRNFYSTDKIQVTCDQFPYGIMLELELKDSDDESALLKEVQTLGLNENDASDLSCDDMYFKLCKDVGQEALPDIAFSDTTMPKIK